MDTPLQSINYQKLQQDPKEAARKAVHRLMRYSEQVHFIYELLQNADDAGKRGNDEKPVRMGFVLRDKELVVWNDGRSFDEHDIGGVLAIGQSSKDLTQIGAFGIGFKSIYVYTDQPEIYSGSVRFCIENYLEAKELNETPTDLQQWADDGKTVFRLPFKPNLRETALPNLKHRLRNASLRSLLFLRRLHSVEWQDSNGESGNYLSKRRSFGALDNAEFVTLSARIGETETTIEEWLVLHTQATPPKEIIKRLLVEAEDDDARERITRSAGQPQPIDVAFRVVDEILVPTEDCVLFAYLPTQKETHLKFLFQARYVTTAGRDNIETDSEWNKWLLKETAAFLPIILLQFRNAGKLMPAFLDALPLAGDGVPDFLAELSGSLTAALKEQALIPAENGSYGFAKRIFYPASEELRRLLSPEDVAELTEIEGALWLHPEIRDTKASQRRFDVVKAAGVAEIGASKLVTWLAKKGADWLESKDDAWLLACYRYLNAQAAEKERVKKLPLVRLDNGDHVCASDQPTFLPPENETERSELAPFLGELPVVKTSLLSGEGRAPVEAFLKELGVKPLVPEEFILNWLLPHYGQDTPVRVELNLQHVRYLAHAINRVPAGEKPKVCEVISNTPLLQAKDKSAPATIWASPSKVYLPRAVTGSGDLEVFFSATTTASFILPDYMAATDDVASWRKFLSEIGCADLPRRFQNPNTGSNTKDWLLEGLEAALASLERLQVSEAQNLSEAIWRLLVHSLPNTEWGRNQWSNGEREIRGPRGGYYGREDIEASFVGHLKQTAWLFGQDGKLHKPSEHFQNTPENRQLLGDSVTYVVASVRLESDPEQWLAKRLGMNLTPTTEHALQHLRQLKGKPVNPEIPAAIYQFLARQGAQRREEFQRETLIYSKSPSPMWCNSGAAFWEDESSVFGGARGYLHSQYPESLKPFFSSVGVAERAGELDYLRAIREISKTAIVSNEIRGRVHNLYRRIWSILQEDKPLLRSPLWIEMWNALIAGKCWLGHKDDAASFFQRDELVWRDNDYLSQLFSGQVALWMFEDLADFAKKLGVAPCSSAEPIFSPLGEQESLSDWTEKLREAASDVRCFLTSPKWREQLRTSASLDVLPMLEVRLIEEAKVSFSLKGAVIPEAEPRSSYLDADDNTVWLVLKAPQTEYPELIGEALQDFFGTPELREFVKDLLSADSANYPRILARWQKRGLRLTKDQDQSSGSSAQRQENQTDERKKQESPSPEANEATRENRSSVETPSATTRETKSSHRARPEKATQQPKSAQDKTLTVKNSESRQRQDYYRTYVGKDEQQEATESSGAKQEHRENLNRAGVNRVLEHETKSGRNPTEMPHTHPGYDVESKNQLGGIERFIEVKSCPGDWDRKGVALTKTQFEKAVDEGDRFWLYVVERAEADNFNIIRIQNPGRLVNQFFYDDGWREVGE
ncbi:MAG: DUF3883 domain-containing protein [Verrucomicrobiota bacterium]|jgi:anti-sigma regulatory factor (Ser/Thr protein kinase)